MCDHNACPIVHEFIEAGLNKLLALAVKSGGCLIEYQNRRVLENGARNCDTLALPSAQFHTTFAYESTKPIGKFLDELEGMGFFGCLDNLFTTRLLLAVGDVIAQTTMEEHRLL